MEAWGVGGRERSWRVLLFLPCHSGLMFQCFLSLVGSRILEHSLGHRLQEFQKGWNKTKMEQRRLWRDLAQPAVFRGCWRLP